MRYAALALDAAVAHRQDARAAFGERRIVRDDDERRAVRIDTVEQRRDLFSRLCDRARRSARRPAAGRGRFASARAIATRCISPPDNSDGR